MNPESQVPRDLKETGDLLDRKDLQDFRDPRERLDFRDLQVRQVLKESGVKLDRKEILVYRAPPDRPDPRARLKPSRQISSRHLSGQKYNADENVQSTRKKKTPWTLTSIEL